MAKSGQSKKAIGFKALEESHAKILSHDLEREKKIVESQTKQQMERSLTSPKQQKNR